MREGITRWLVWGAAVAFAATAAAADPELARILALEESGHIYEARRSLDKLAKDSSDLAVLKHQAEFTDLYGGPAAEAAKRYAEALAAVQDPGLMRVLERGSLIAAREGSPAVGNWFENRISAIKNPGSQLSSSLRASVTGKTGGVWIPGGIDGLSFIVGAPSGIRPERFLVDYCRRISARAAGGSPQELILFQKQITGYFEGLRRLVALSKRSGDKAILTLSLAKPSQQQTQRVLELLGWKLVRTKQKILVQAIESKGQAGNQDLASALAIDQSGMQSAFQKGASFSVEIPFDSVPVLFDEATWQTSMQTNKLAGGLAEALVKNPDFARAYLGFGNVDRPTASVLLTAVGLSSRFAELLANYSSALAIVNGRAAVPGGMGAEAVWTKLAGASPADPSRFFRALFEKDSGRLLIWFFQLSELDAAHQRFFTSSQRRIDDFYEAFTQSQDVSTRAGRLTRSNTFSEFLRSVPLDGNSVDFPGSAEVWMVANGRTVTAEQSGKMMKKVRKAVPPEVEDSILLRLARIRDKQEEGSVSETAAFLAVARIDEHRREPLEQQPALLLGQNYNEYLSFYPYFSEFRELTTADFQAFFGLLAKLKTAEESESEMALGQFEALLELLRLGMNRGVLTEERATALLRKTCMGFTAAQDRAGYTTAALDEVREMLGTGDADAAMRQMVLGPGVPIEIEMRSGPVTVDVSHKREVSYGRVLDLQKAPSLALLLRMDESARQLAAGKQSPRALADSLSRDAAALPVVQIPKNVKFEGRAKQAIAASSTAKLLQVTAELRQTASKKKVNPKDLQKAAREILEALAQQVRLGLAGAVYAANLEPGDILVSSDPLLLRKHQTFDLSAATSRRPRFPRSSLQEASVGEGSYFVGGFANFSLVAAGAHAGSRTDASSALWVNQLAAIRMTPWSRYSDAGQRLLGIRLRMAREWCVAAGANPVVFNALSEDTLGVISLTRRRQLLDAIAAKRWAGIQENLTLTDQLVLADRYLARYLKNPWASPVDDLLRHAAAGPGGDVEFLGPMPVLLYGCSHPHLVPLAPYEEYAHHLFPTEMAERAAELKVYLADAMDTAGIPAAAMSAIAESVAKKTFSGMKMSDERDWTSALRAFAGIDGKAVESAIEGVL